jgi:hypothetical protein
LSSTPSLETFLAVTDEMLGLEEKWHSLSGACLRKISGYILFTISLMSCVSAQELSEIPARLIIPDGIPVKLRLAESVSSAHARVGDLLDFIVVKDVSVGGFTIIQAGTMARGSITGVKGRRFLGIGGKVSLKLDSVELFNGDRVGLRAKEEVKGGSRTKLMVGGMIVTSLIFLPATPVFLLTLGRACTVLKSTEVTARIDAGSSVLSAGLQRSQERSSELQEMMDYLPPRVFNREGREGDMLNLVFVAQQANLQEAFEHAGWVKTDKWGPALVWQLLRRGTHDTGLPMARFYLFGRVQDYSYALPDPAAVVSRRHHIRIWKTDYTLDGTPLWIGAATHDIAIEIAKRGRSINHRIDPEVDAERDFIGVNLTEASSVTEQQYLHGVAPVFEAQTSSGEAYHSDGRILLLDLHQIALARTGLPAQSSTIVGATSLPIAAPAESFLSNLRSPR